MFLLIDAICGLISVDVYVYQLTKTLSRLHDMYDWCFHSYF